MGLVPLFLPLLFALACQPPSEVALAGHDLAVPLTWAAGKAPEEKLTAALRSSLAAAPAAGGSRRVLVDLAVQVDLPELARRLGAGEGRDRRERRALAVAALEQVAGSSQEDLRPFLERARGRGLVRSFRGFAVVNRLLVEATPQGIAALSRRREVATIAEETELPVPALALGGELLPADDARISWGVEAIGAAAAWDRGLDGRGVVVGAIDSGASAAHEQLRDGFRGGPAAWLDPAGGSAMPRDTTFGHGTGVLSCAVGRNVRGVTLGVAPGARWVACAGLPAGRYNNVLLTECADWMLRVARPDVLLNAWVLPAGGCDRSLERIVAAWRAAGILPVFPAGNHGPGAGTDRSPANYAALLPGDGPVLSVGGLTATGAPFARSSQGPSSCGGPLFPVLSGPGEDLVAAFPLTPSTYVRAEGTSFAAAFAAGAAAILLQAAPEATVAQVEAALRQGAADLGPPGPDDTFGHGRIDVTAALAALARQRPFSPSSHRKGQRR